MTEATARSETAEPHDAHALVVCERAWALRWRNPVLSTRVILDKIKRLEAAPQRTDCILGATQIVAAANAVYVGDLAASERLATNGQALIGPEDHLWFARSAAVMTTLLYSSGRRSEAGEMLHAGMERANGVKDTAAAAETMSEFFNLLAITHLYSQEQDRAVETVTQACALAEEAGLRAQIARSLSNRARTSLRAHNYDLAEQQARDALDYIVTHRFVVLEPYLREVLGEILMRTGRLDEAVDMLNHGLEQAARMPDNRARCQILVVLGQVLQLAGKGDQGLDVLSQGQQIADRIAYPMWQRRFRLAIAEAHERLGNAVEALAAYKLYMDMDRKLFGAETEQHMNKMRANFEVQQAKKVADVERARSAELEAARAKAEKLAWTDTLTGLGNRERLISRLHEALHSAPQERVILLLIDLDRFKQVNDTYGHEAGDTVLIRVAQRLQQVFGDIGSAYRLGGDEFAVLVEGNASVSDVQSRTATWIKQVQEPVPYNGRSLYIGASIGIGLFPDNAEAADSLLRVTDIALYEAKNSGRGKFQLYEPEVDRRTQRELQLEDDLSLAIENDELILQYQPVVDTHSGQVVGAEALVRWMHPHQGRIQPKSFLNVVERTDLVFEFGAWVIWNAWQTLCRWSTTWPEHEITISVNISARQFFDDKLTELLQDLAIRNPAVVPRLDLEITEQTMTDQIDRATARLKEIGDLGFSVSIDDFGTGFSSISHLAQVPLNRLKIDNTFIPKSPDEIAKRCIVLAIIGLGHSLDLTVVAEGVELPDQHEFLRANGCDLYQGFLFAHPCDAKTFEELYLRSEDRGASVG